MYASRDQVLVVDRAVRGVLVVDFLMRQLPRTRQIHVRHLVADGLVRVNGEVANAGRRLGEGDVVQVVAAALAALPVAPAPAPEPLAVLFESAGALVVGKPPKVPTVPDRSGRERGIHGRLDGLRPGADLRIVHRLDRDTSGCLLLGKGLAAARHFDRQFRAGAIAKRYVALVHGVVAGDCFAIDAWLGPDPARPGRVIASQRRRSGFREAHTAVEVVERYRDHTLLHLRPTTGRGHQLRAHLASSGHPIVADLDYGGRLPLLSEQKRGYKLRPGTTERPLLDRMFLHAASLSFPDLDGAVVTVDAPLPADLTTALRRLERPGRR